jgi:hypothetical protein
MDNVGPIVTERDRTRNGASAKKLADQIINTGKISSSSFRHEKLWRCVAANTSKMKHKQLLCTLFGEVALWFKPFMNFSRNSFGVIIIEIAAVITC